MHVVVGELVPKGLALSYSERIALGVSVPVRAFFFVFAPLIWVLQRSSEAAQRAIGIDPSKTEGEAHSEAELKMLLEVSTEHGEIEQGEREMLYKVFDFADKEASDVMVPRPEVVGISVEMAPEEALRAVLESPYTRYPVYRESLDEIVGILHVRDLVSALHDSAIAEVELAALLRPAYVVPETKDLAALLAEFRRTNQHMSVVVDEYGSTVGVVTLEDLLEEIVGEIEDEFDLPDESVERVDETTIRIDGTFPIDDFNEEFGTTLEHEDYHTVAGYVFDLIGRAAEPGDEVRDRRPAVHGARGRGLEDPAARGGVPAGARAGRRGRRGGVARTASTVPAGRFAAPAPRLRPLPRRHARDGLRDRDVVRRDRLAGLRRAEQSARPRARRARDVHPAAAPRAAGRASRRPLPAPHAARDRDRARRSRSCSGCSPSPARAPTRRGRSSCSRSARASPRRSARRPPAR